MDMVTTAERERMRLVVPAIRYTDILCLNEHESEIAAGIPLRDENDALIYENIPKVLRRFRELGARKWAVIHAPEGGFGLDEKGEYHAVAGAVVPKEYIGGTVGAGDAFTSGILLGAHRDSTLEEALTYATAAAVASLRNLSLIHILLSARDSAADGLYRRGHRRSSELCAPRRHPASGRRLSV